MYCGVLTIGFLWCSLPWACKERQQRYLLQEDLEGSWCALMTFLDIASVLSPTAPLRVRVFWALRTFSSRSISTRACVIHRHLITKGQTFLGLCVTGKRTCTYVLLTKSPLVSFQATWFPWTAGASATLTHFKYFHGGWSWWKNDSYVYKWLPADLLWLSFCRSWDGPHWGVKPFVIF